MDDNGGGGHSEWKEERDKNLRYKAEADCLTQQRVMTDKDIYRVSSLLIPLTLTQDMALVLFRE